MSRGLAWLQATKVAAGESITAASLTLSATTTGSTASAYGATAVAGAGGPTSKISVAGALGLNIVNLTTDAELDSPATLTGGNATLTAAADATSVASATPARPGWRHRRWVWGPSVALNLITDTTTAVIDNGVTLTGADNLTLTATDTDAATPPPPWGRPAVRSASPRPSP